jgi:tetratricopeptide (TPR) repeat protein
MKQSISTTLKHKTTLLERLGPTLGSRSPEESIRRVAVNHRIIQEFRPLVQSLEWQLSDLYWANDGAAPFIRSQVPFIINNSGRLSEDAAALLFANCLEKPAGADPIRVLELGAGTGLFARYFLNAFRIICQQENQDFYHRLEYFVSDRSRCTCGHWLEQGLFEDHREHVFAGVCAGNQPTHFQKLSGETAEFGFLRAVFANYVLDVMPSAIVKAGPSGPEQLCIRTHLAHNNELISQYSDLTLAQVQEIVKSDSPTERARLLPILSLFEFDTQFLPVGDDKPPYLEEVLEYGKSEERSLLNFGAIQCLQKCLTALDENGFVLLNDYGPTEGEQVASHAVTQRFGSSLALGLNFPFLEHHFSNCGKVWVNPGDKERGIHARMICRSDLPCTRDMFLKRFGTESLKFFEGPIEEAARHAAAGRNDQALESYRLALERNPHNWHLIGQAAEFVSLQLRNFEAGLELIRSALEYNPCYSTWLWNVLGDCLFCLERFADAHEAYLQAYAINSDDVRTNFNLSYTFCNLGRYDESLRAIAHGLATDAQGLYRERLLNKQGQILSLVSAREINERDRLMKRVAAFS